MRQTFQLILYVAVATVLTAGCTGKRERLVGRQASRPHHRPPAQPRRNPFCGSIATEDRQDMIANIR